MSVFGLCEEFRFLKIFRRQKEIRLPRCNDCECCPEVIDAFKNDFDDINILLTDNFKEIKISFPELNCAIQAGTRRQEGTLFLQQPWQADHQQVRGGSTLRKLMVRILDLHIFPMTT